MTVSAHRLRQILMVIAGSLGACSMPDQHDAKDVVRPSEKAASTVDCQNMGELACSMAPLKAVSGDVCAYLNQCLGGRDVGDVTINNISDCDAPVLTVDNSYGSAAAVGAAMDVEGAAFHGAFLLVRSKPGGWCLADTLLEPAWSHGGYCEAQFQLKWLPTQNHQPPDLMVLAERLCYMPLDQEEIAAGESDLASEECWQKVYTSVNNTLTIQSQTDKAVPCLVE